MGIYVDPTKTGATWFVTRLNIARAIYNEEFQKLLRLKITQQWLNNEMTSQEFYNKLIAANVSEINIQVFIIVLEQHHALDLRLISTDESVK